ncbi:nitrite reductase [Vibrio algarum]|uniref:Nitrite reductase n=1 Tax=Vibrio algarum TaxID=3020714 RepID=A0ABT4YQG8_9VIBR|nr:nitrite reductase [Vibrio sp. KJ40-1]MDB1123753.1 nitrite reductase [Vibrio sp. KJ40-1]
MSPDKEQQKVVKLAVPLTIDEIIGEIQDKLREDKNNADLWFQLGQGYFANGEFDNANTCFDYVIRLTDEPSSTVFAAKATAQYYISSQRMTDEVMELLDIALSKDRLNDTALMLIANDHFISFRYDQAIETWQKVLDSERQGIDRVTIINSINKTQQLQNN